MMLFFDLAPSPLESGALWIGAVFFLVACAGAFIAFKLLKRTVKMAFRMVIVAVILVIAIVGSIALWALESKPTPRPVPRNSR
jgi:hypothetical protein